MYLCVCESIHVCKCRHMPQFVCEGQRKTFLRQVGCCCVCKASRPTNAGAPPLPPLTVGILALQTCATPAWLYVGSGDLGHIHSQHFYIWGHLPRPCFIVLIEMNFAKQDISFIS